MTTAKPSAKRHNLRNRKGGFTARCERCNCPAGCACSPAEPCFCGTNPDGSEREEAPDALPDEQPSEAALLATVRELVAKGYKVAEEGAEGGVFSFALMFRADDGASVYLQWEAGY